MIHLELNYTFNADAVSQAFLAANNGSSAYDLILY
jgi:hypothetical protein